MAGRSIGKRGNEGEESLEARRVESFLVVYVCVFDIPIDAKRQFLRPRRGLMTK
jgi:hypothetical protein